MHVSHPKSRSQSQCDCGPPSIMPNIPLGGKIILRRACITCASTFTASSAVRQQATCFVHNIGILEPIYPIQVLTLAHDLIASEKPLQYAKHNYGPDHYQYLINAPPLPPCPSHPRRDSNALPTPARAHQREVLLRRVRDARHT